MEVVNDLLEYKNLKIVQDSKMFSFSLDSVLLPNFVTLNPKVHHILDIGCGNAPVSMILTTKTKAHITAVEIQPDVYRLAKKSVQMNHLEKQIDILQGDIKEIYKNLESDSFDTSFQIHLILK